MVQELRRSRLVTAGQVRQWGAPASGEAAGEGPGLTSPLSCGPRRGPELGEEKFGLSVRAQQVPGQDGAHLRLLPPPQKPVLASARQGCKSPISAPGCLRGHPSFPGEQASPAHRRRMPGPGPGHPSLKAVSVFKPLLPKWQLRLFFGISHSPRLALLKTLIKLFIGGDQIVGPGVSRFLERPGCLRLCGLLVQALPETLAGELGRPPRSC